MRVIHRLHIYTFGVLLSWMLSAPMPCFSSNPPYQHSEESKARPASTHQHRTLQSNDYCSLCQGRDMLSDKQVTSDRTCSDIDNFYRFDWNTTKKTKPSAAESCRAEIEYNNFSELCCKTSIPRYECEHNVHDVLFGDRATKRYKSIVPPIVGMDKPLDVRVFVRYDTMQEIEMDDSTVGMFLNINLMWNDPRLVWNVTDDDTCTNMIDVFAGYDAETSMIWVPDFDLRNKVDGLLSLPTFKASLYSDGTVRWRISGVLKGLCAFSGLANIPYDTMGCQFLFGGQSRVTSKFVNYVLDYPDQIFIGSFDVTYRDWKLLPERTTQGTALGGNFLYYNFYFERPRKYYTNNIVIPTIVFTYLSFLVFFLDIRTGERLGFGMAVTLVIIAQQIITVGLSPVSNEKLWLDSFVAWSFYFVLFSLVESSFIAFLYFLRKDKNKKEENEGYTNAKRKKKLAHKNNFGVSGTLRDKEEPDNGSNDTPNKKNGLVGDSHDSDKESQNEDKEEMDSNSDEHISSASFTAGLRGDEEPQNEGNDSDEDTNEFHNDKHISSISSSFLMGFNSEHGTSKKNITFNDAEPHFPPSRSMGFLYDVSLRKIDMISLVMSTVLYTIFIIGMICANRAGLWLKNDPEWFHEKSPLYTQIFDANDPTS